MFSANKRRARYEIEIPQFRESPRDSVIYELLPMIGIGPLFIFVLYKMQYETNNTTFCCTAKMIGTETVYEFIVY